MNNNIWRDCYGNRFTIDQIKKDIDACTLLGCKVYIGSDSMLFTEICNFVSVIALHSKEHNIARYYFQRYKADSKLYRELQIKILKEAEIAIEAAQLINGICPNVKIELHLDIGNKKKNKTSQFYNIINGWVTGTGFELKIKPYSWASSLADSHTKGRGNKI